MSYTLLSADGTSYESDVKGQLGGHRRSKIYGRLDCPSALRAIASGGYTRHRVFFADEATAIAAGYRPCAICCPDRYQTWKASRPLLGSSGRLHSQRRRVPMTPCSNDAVFSALTS